MVFSVDVCASALMHTSRQCQYQQQREQTLHPDTGLSPFLLGSQFGPLRQRA